MVGERLHEFEVSVIHVHLVVAVVSSKQEIPRRPAGDCQPCIGSTRSRHRNDGIVGVRLRRPTTDRPVERGEDEDRRPALYLVVVRTVEDDPRWRAGPRAVSRRYLYLQALLVAGAVVKS